MKYKFNFFLIFLFISLLSSHVFAKNSVLIINSYHLGYKFSDMITNPILDRLKKENIASNILYLNSLRINDKTYTQTFRNLYAIENSKNNYNIIIAIGSNAMEFVKNNSNILTKEQKIIYIGDESAYEKRLLNKEVFAILKRVNILDNIELIYKFLPKIKKIHIIDENIKSNKKNIYIKYNEVLKDKSFKIVYTSYDSLDSLKSQLSNLKENEVILYVKLKKDENANLLSFNDISNLFNSLNSLVFITNTINSKQNVIGGKLLDNKILAQKAIDLLMGLLNHEVINEKVVINKDFVYIFNYEKIKEHNFNPLTLHKPFTYVNSSLSIFEEDNILIDFVFIVSPFLLMVILLLLYILFFKIKSGKMIEQRVEVDKVLLDAIKTPVVWQDDKGKIVNSNSQFQELLQLPFFKEVTLRNFLDNNSFDLLLEKLRTYNKYKNNPDEIAFISENNCRIFIINQTQYHEGIFNTKGKFTVFIDITKERLALEEKIKHQEFMIQQSKLAEIGEIFSSIAHQWKTPLLEITTIAQEQIYNKTNNKQIDEENNEFVNDIMVQVKYMGETISDFQNFIMPSTRKVSFNISEAVTKMLEIINHNIKYNYIKTEIKVEEGARLNILGYKNELMQILLNIVNNAKDAIVKRRKNKEVKEGKIRIEIRNEKEDVIIQIEDNGGGIPKEHIRNIFKAYYTTKENGHGIGLYMAKLIIEDKMDGSIWVENTKNGAKFSIKLKLDSNFS
ncbi:signal transduction sensor histidine kinase [Malaciobacter halophilus]|nr:signal transduction sensor histidine kinase [Malaciobacter halophilus]